MDPVLSEEATNQNQLESLANLQRRIKRAEIIRVGGALCSLLSFAGFSGIFEAIAEYKIPFTSLEIPKILLPIFLITLSVASLSAAIYYSIQHKKLMEEKLTLTRAYLKDYFQIKR